MSIFITTLGDLVSAGAVLPSLLFATTSDTKVESLFTFTWDEDELIVTRGEATSFGNLGQKTLASLWSPFLLRSEAPHSMLFLSLSVKKSAEPSSVPTPVSVKNLDDR